MLRIPHGILAQVYVCTLFAIAASLSRPWVEGGRAQAHTDGEAANSGKSEVGAGLRRLAVTATFLIFVQLVVAALMRHNNAGLAIPTFPLTPEGGLVPTQWDFRVAIHFAHRVMALVLTGALVTLAVGLWRTPRAGQGFKCASGLIIGLLITQIVLGAVTVWTTRNPYYATAHVIVGAVLLATVFTVTWWTHRDSVDRMHAPSLAA